MMYDIGGTVYFVKQGTEDRPGVVTTKTWNSFKDIYFDLDTHPFLEPGSFGWKSAERLQFVCGRVRRDGFVPIYKWTLGGFAKTMETFEGYEVHLAHDVLRFLENMLKSKAWRHYPHVFLTDDDEIVSRLGIPEGDYCMTGCALCFCDDNDAALVSLGLPGVMYLDLRAVVKGALSHR